MVRFAFLRYSMLFEFCTVAMCGAWRTNIPTERMQLPYLLKTTKLTPRWPEIRLELIIFRYLRNTQTFILFSGDF